MYQPVVTGTCFAAIVGIVWLGSPQTITVSADLTSQLLNAMPTHPPEMKDDVKIALRPSLQPQGIPATHEATCPPIQDHQVKLIPGNQQDVALINQVATEQRIDGEWCRSHAQQELRWVSNQSSEQQAIVVLKTFLSRGLEGSH